MTTKTNCCYECKKRELGCHSKCAEYAEFKKELNKINARKEEYRKSESLSFKFSYARDVIL